MPIFKIFIQGEGYGRKPATHRTPEAALAAYRDLCAERTDAPATAILCEGNTVRKRCRLDRDWRGRRTQQDDPIMEGEEVMQHGGRPAMSDEPVRAYPLRLPDSLRARIEQRAGEAGTSLNQCILDLLEGAL